MEAVNWTVVLPKKKKKKEQEEEEEEKKKKNNNNIWWEVQTMKLVIMQFSPAPCYFPLLGPNIFLSTLFWSILSLQSPLNMKTKFNTHAKQQEKSYLCVFYDLFSSKG